VALSTSVGPPLSERSLATLAFALAGSLLLHGALIALPRWKPRAAPDLASLTVRLVAPPVVVPAAPAPAPAPGPEAATPERARAEPPSPSAATREATRKSAREPERSRAPSREARPPPAPVPPLAQPRPAPEPMPQKDLQAVYERLAQDDQLYPEEAIRRGLSGEVVLIVEIGAGGRIVGASVATSSGHRILDDAALRAVRRLGGLGTGNAGRSFLLTIRFVP
jgi:protein TonB